MKNRFIVVYTAFAAAVFIFSLGFFAYNLYNEYSTNITKSQDRFTKLENDLRTLSNNYEENTSEFSKAIKGSIGDAAAFSYIQIRRDNETVILYPTGKSREETISRLTKSYSKTFSVRKHSITADCNIYLIRPDSIFYYARVSFLMILIITIITIIMIIYLNISENTSDVISIKEDDEENEIDNEEEAGPREIENYYSEDIDESDEAAVADESNEADSVDTVEAAEKEEPAASADIEKTEEETAPNTEVTPEEVKAILAEPLTDEQAATAEEVKLPVDEIKPAPLNEEPAGLFDPATGIGWESYLVTRLNNEIDRATASEIDLSLFLIKIPDINMKSENFHNICNYLSIQFQFKDLLFEYKNDGIVAIKISTNIDEALKMADKIYSDICNIIDGNNCRIGISSRSIRMLSGDRLLMEVEQAIEHSDETSPVIAFRVDSEKYRQLMEKNQN